MHPNSILYSGCIVSYYAGSLRSIQYNRDLLEYGYIEIARNKRWHNLVSKKHYNTDEGKLR